nr:retrovirus-related Pol polyprotein from transposon TNT 1-94 [Tanacetum cinerariifolium]
KWVLKNKKDERGIVIRNKVRLVAQGHTHKEGIDYKEVFTPVARIEAIRLFLAYASFMGFTVYQMDVKSAFLYGTIDKEVYVMQPPRFQDPEFLASVYKVEKAMYGLHQAPRAWFEDILRVTTNTGDTNEVEADLRNMENNISASPTPTFKIHKDHLTSQIIGYVDTPNVWSLVDCPEGVRPIGTKWVLKNKKDERGIVIRNKVRLVAQGHTHKEGIDYKEVFTPVARIEAIRLFLAYASFMGFTVYQMDVKSAFLYGTIDKEVYVMQPPRFQDPEFLASVYKVEKAMYGLHQAPRAWYVDTSLIHIESRKPPTAELFDVDSGRISIHHHEY